MNYLNRNLWCLFIFESILLLLFSSLKVLLNWIDDILVICTYVFLTYLVIRYELFLIGSKTALQPQFHKIFQITKNSHWASIIKNYLRNSSARQKPSQLKNSFWYININMDIFWRRMWDYAYKKILQNTTKKTEFSI